MERYNKYGNIEKIPMQFEPLKVNQKIQKNNFNKKEIINSACCYNCKDNLCFYNKYKEYCSNNFLGKRDCEKLFTFNKKQEMLKIILS